jgi:hypothetical protein
MTNKITAINKYPVTNFFFVLESASLNFLSKFRETETDRREFPRALNLMRLV